MDAKEWLDSRETRERIVSVTYRAYSEERKKEWRYGQGKIYIVDKTNRIGILLTDFGDGKEVRLRAGDIVRFKTPHPEVNELLIDSTATIRDHEHPRIPFPDDRESIGD